MAAWYLGACSCCLNLLQTCVHCTTPLLAHSPLCSSSGTRGTTCHGCQCHDVTATVGCTSSKFGCAQQPIHRVFVPQHQTWAEGNCAHASSTQPWVCHICVPHQCHPRGQQTISTQHANMSKNVARKQLVRGHVPAARTQPQKCLPQQLQRREDQTSQLVVMSQPTARPATPAP
jgi:hypothetical protein